MFTKVTKMELSLSRFRIFEIKQILQLMCYVLYDAMKPVQLQENVPQTWV